MSDRRPTALVVGASRGIGRAMLDKLAEAGYDTFGTVRDLAPYEGGVWRGPEHGIYPGPGGTAVFRADLRDEASLRAAASAFDRQTNGGNEGDGAGVPLDVLVVSGAIAGDEPYLDMKPERLLEFYDTNVVGPLRAVQAFLPALRRQRPSASSSSEGEAGQRIIVLLTSQAADAKMRASVALTQPRSSRLPISSGPYGGTKAGLNMLGIGLFTELEAEGFKVLLIDPGLVNTDMAQAMIGRVRALGEGATPWTVIEADESAAGIANVVKTAVKAEIPVLWHRDYKGIAQGG